MQNYKKGSNSLASLKIFNFGKFFLVEIRVNEES